jgi:hypothetical protein
MNTIAVVVIYVPPRSSEDEKLFLDENVKKVEGNHEGFKIFYVEDPARTQAEFEVHFNPYFNATNET